MVLMYIKIPVHADECFCMRKTNYFCELPGKWKKEVLIRKSQILKVN